MLVQYVFAVLVTISMGFKNANVFESDILDHHRSLILKVFPFIDLGQSKLIPGRTVFGGQIKTWDSKDFFPLDFRPFVNDTNIYQIRSDLYDKMAPLHVLQWPVIDYRPCPHFQHNVGHRNERGHAASHLQIWLEFSYFDHDTNEARFRFKPEYTTSTSYSSVSGTFQALENGTLIRNGRQFLDNDLMIIFEDGVVPDPKFNLTLLMKDIQNAEPFDIMSLMNCSQPRLQALSIASNVHSSKAVKQTIVDSHGTTMCMAAYVITRKAAKTLSRLIDICGKRIEHQLAAFAVEDFITIGKLTSTRSHFVDVQAT